VTCGCLQIRVQLSKEFVQDLGRVQEENTILYRETLQVGVKTCTSALCRLPAQPGA
jgi:hypothetical protein